MKTLLIKSFIDFTMTMAIISTVFEETIKDSAVYILVAVVIATLNAIFEYVFLPVMKKCRNYLKTKTPDNFNKIIDDIFDKSEGDIKKFKDNIIENLKQKQPTKEDDEDVKN